MKKWMKIGIPVGAALVIGIGALTMFSEDIKGYKNYETAANHQPSEIKTTTLNQNNTTSNEVTPISTRSTSQLVELSGKVVEVTKDQITIEVPLQGTKVYQIDSNTRIEDFLIPLEKGVLVDIDANNDLAYQIETDNTIDAYGTIIAITNKEVTIDYNGTQKNFTKAANFRIDADEYKGPLEGLPTEITFNEDLQIEKLEIELDHEDFDGDDD